MRRSRRATRGLFSNTLITAAIIYGAMCGTAFGQIAHCDGTCPTGPSAPNLVKCRFGCSEAEYRTAIKSANSCVGMTSVVIEFDASLCPTCSATQSPYIDCCGPSAIDAGCSQDQFDCYIDIANAASETLETCHPVDKAACLTGSNITLDGTTRMVLQWKGARTITFEDGLCSEDPKDRDLNTVLRSPLRIKGQNNRVVRLAVQYFTDGMKIVEGSGHKIQGLWAERICDDAVDVPGVIRDATGACAPTAQSNVTVESSSFRGLTLADYTETGFWCVNGMHLPAPCGLGKAVQINGSTNVTVRSNEFHSISIPVRVCTIAGGVGGCGNTCPFGPVSILSNTIHGLPPGENAAQCDYEMGSATPGFCENKKFFIPVAFPENGVYYESDCADASKGLQIGESGSLTTVDSNTIDYSRWGMRVEAGARVRATRNVFKMNHGAAIAVSDTAARVIAELNTFVLNGCNEDVTVVYPGNLTVLANGGQVIVTKLRRGNEAGLGVAPTDPSRVDLGGGDRDHRGVFSPSFYDCTNFNQPDYLANCSYGGNKFCRDPHRTISFLQEEEIVNSTTNGIGASVGVGSAIPSCAGQVGSTTALVGRAVSQVNSGGGTSNGTGTRCTTSVLPASTNPQNCTIDAATSCDCTGLFP